MHCMNIFHGRGSTILDTVSTPTYRTTRIDRTLSLYPLRSSEIQHTNSPTSQIIILPTAIAMIVPLR